MVATGRHMDPAKVRELADGRAYTGRQALALGLIDAIGGEADARSWLAVEGRSGLAARAGRGRPSRSDRRTLGGLFGDLRRDFGESLFSQGVMLDGALALWQPGVK